MDKTHEYKIGYDDGFKEGYLNAFEHYDKHLLMAHLCSPQKIIVTTEEFERIKKKEKNDY